MRTSDAAARPPDGEIVVRCKFFAVFADMLERDSLDLALPRTATVADAVEQLRAALRHGDRLPHVPMTAVNCEHAGPTRRLADGDELALLPPLAGG